MLPNTIGTVVVVNSVCLLKAKQCNAMLCYVVCCVVLCLCRGVGGEGGFYLEECTYGTIHRKSCLFVCLFVALSRKAGCWLLVKDLR